MKTKLTRLTLNKLRSFSIAYGALMVSCLFVSGTAVATQLGLLASVFVVVVQVAGFYAVFRVYQSQARRADQLKCADQRAEKLLAEVEKMKGQCQQRTRLIETIGEMLLATSRPIHAAAEFLENMKSASMAEGDSGSVEQNLLVHARKGLAVSQDIVEFSYLHKGEVELVEQEIDPVELAAFCIATAQKNSETNDVIELSGKPKNRLVLTGDLGRLKQSLIKLIEFAVRHREKNNPLSSVRVVQDRSGDLVFSIAFSGFYLCQQSFKQLCQPLEASSSQGIIDQMVTVDFSLAIACDIARLHGGEIAIGKGAAYGTELLLRMPAKRVAEVADAVIEPAAGGSCDNVIFQIG